MRNYYFASVMLLSFVTYAMEDKDRIYMDVFINDQPVKLIFDTGAEGPILFREAARRLNLQVSEPPSVVQVKPGEVKFALAKNCRLRFEDGGTESLVTFGVVDILEQIHANCDGVFGWGGIRHMMFEMSFAAPRIKFRNTISFDKSKWKCLDIKKDSNILVVKLPGEDSTQDYLLIDTGDQGGMTVRKELWQRLAGDLSDQNTTLFSVYYPGVGLVVEKEKWIQQINIGGLTFHGIPVRMGMEVHQNLTDTGIDGVIGIWGLTCYNWIVDGPAGKIYFQPNELVRIPEKCTYNRLGAVFVPCDIQTGKALIAHVIKNSPAYTAGIRDSDELLRISQLDVTKWRTDPNVLPLSRFWEKPAGTELDLVLMRDGEQKKIKVKLAEIFRQ